MGNAPGSSRCSVVMSQLPATAASGVMLVQCKMAFEKWNKKFIIFTVTKSVWFMCRNLSDQVGNCPVFCCTFSTWHIVFVMRRSWASASSSSPKWQHTASHGNKTPCLSFHCDIWHITVNMRDMRTWNWSQGEESSRYSFFFICSCTFPALLCQNVFWRGLNGSGEMRKETASLGLSALWSIATGASTEDVAFSPSAWLI